MKVPLLYAQSPPCKSENFTNSHPHPSMNVNKLAKSKYSLLLPRKFDYYEIKSAKWILILPIKVNTVIYGWIDFLYLNQVSSKKMKLKWPSLVSR
jgi:hypothetical protein